MTADTLVDAPALPYQNGSTEAKLKERGSFGKLYTYKVITVLMSFRCVGKPSIWSQG